MTQDTKDIASAPAGDGVSMYPKDHLENIEKAIDYCDRRLADRFGNFIRATLQQCRHDPSCGTFDNYSCDCPVGEPAALASSRDHDHASGGKVIYGEAAEREARRHGADSFAGKEFASAPAGQEHDRYANDEAAKALYDSWSSLPGWVPWVDRGNSTMQEKARREVAR